MRQLLSHEEMGDQTIAVPQEPDKMCFAPFGPLVYFRTFKPHLPGRLDSALYPADRVGKVTQPTTSSISLSVPDDTAGLLECVEDLSKWCHKPTAAHTTHTHTYTPLPTNSECTLADLTTTYKKHKND
jgi:hypothetical protein